ncbi:MAG: exodeoxyribonuclease VII small subunit [Oscillospiraceae bacterium]|jgi:exodeoxyribonuclease VII small subunit|nr:exodeoxyribonuclease VII small subunit [Oscillospiraceae bacterium]
MEKLSYEQALNQLEALVEKLQEGSLPLDETLSVYEEAARLAVLCGKQLEAAKQKLTSMND